MVTFSRLRPPPLESFVCTLVSVWLRTVKTAGIGEEEMVSEELTAGQSLCTDRLEDRQQPREVGTARTGDITLL